MKQLVMSIFLLAITSCAAEPAPASTSTATDDETEATDVDPRAMVCEPAFGQCETIALCEANGGHVAGVCTNNQGICCHFAF
jgi:hypothetical protein